jgi:uncharacterized damage-inducible protein DinB
MNTTDIQTLFAYNRWANRRLFSVVEKLSDAQFIAQIQSSFPSIRDTVFHILAAEWIWLKRWKGTSPRASVAAPNLSPATWKTLTAGGIPPVQELSTVAGLRAFADSLEHERQEFLSSLSDEAFHANLSFNDMAGTPYSEPLVHLLQHLVNHGTYHRGQAITMLRQIGAETVALDMLYFFREEEKEKAATAN